jgi:hypothetical protein
MLEYLAAMESLRVMRESLRVGSRDEFWTGIPARGQRGIEIAGDRHQGSPRHGLALALRDLAARLDPVPA